MSGRGLLSVAFKTLGFIIVAQGVYSGAWALLLASTNGRSMPPMPSLRPWVLFAFEAGPIATLVIGCALIRWGSALARMCSRGWPQQEASGDAGQERALLLVCVRLLGLSMFCAGTLNLVAACAQLVVRTGVSRAISELLFLCRHTADLEYVLQCVVGLILIAGAVCAASRKADCEVTA